MGDLIIEEVDESIADETTNSLVARGKQLITEENQLWATMTERITRGATTETSVMDTDDRESYQKEEVRLDELHDEITVINSHLKARNERAAKEAARSELKVDPSKTGESQHVKERDVHDAAYENWIRFGMSSLKDEERSVMTNSWLALSDHGGGFRAQGALTGAAGGFTVPEGFYTTIQEATLAYGGIANAGTSKISTGTGNDLPIPTNDDSGNSGELLAENAAAATQDTAFGQVTMKAWIWSSKIIRVSLALLQDTAFDLPNYLAGKMGERIGRVQAGYRITGTGSLQPEGILTNVTTGQTAAAAKAFTYSELVGLEHSVDSSYRVSGEYLISDAAVQAARQLVDSNKRPLWQPGLVSGVAIGMPASINGYPYTVDNNMPAVLTGNKPIVFGDLSKYWIRTVKGVQTLRLDERYADSLQVGFLAFSRDDSRPVDAATAYKCLTMG